MTKLLIEANELWLQPLRAVCKPEILDRLREVFGDEFDQWVDGVYVSVIAHWGKHFIAESASTERQHNAFKPPPYCTNCKRSVVYIIEYFPGGERKICGSCGKSLEEKPQLTVIKGGKK